MGFKSNFLVKDLRTSTLGGIFKYSITLKLTFSSFKISTDFLLLLHIGLW